MTTEKVDFTSGTPAVAEFQVTSNVTINIKVAVKSNIEVEQKTCTEDYKDELDFAPTYNLQNVVGTREVTFMGDNFPKYIRIKVTGDTDPVAYYSVNDD